MEVANIIFSQLGGAKFILMTGAKNFSKSDNSLNFKIGRNKSKITHVEIVYNVGKDLYTMNFLRCNLKVGREVLKTVEGVYCDQLQEIFTNETGLYTSL